MFIIIVVWLRQFRPSWLLFYFVQALLLSILTPLFFPSSSVSHARVFRKTLVHEFHISYGHTEWYLFFPIVQLQVHNVYSERKTRNSYALVNLN